MIGLSLLGRVEVEVDGHPFRALTSSPKRLGLLVYLHLARPAGPRQRQSIVGVFWPDQDEYHARQALNQALYYLRHELGPGTIRSAGKELVEIAPGSIRSDVADFDTAIDAGDLERALAVYRGDLLPGFYLSGTVDFERWLDTERDRLRERARSAVQALVARTTAQGELDVALHWAQRARLMAPLDSEFLGTQLDLLSHLGRIGDIHREFRTFEAHLRADLEMEPADVLRRRYEAALNSAKSRPGQAPISPPTPKGEASPTVSTPATPHSHAPRRRPLRLAGGVAMAATAVAAGWYALGRVSDATGTPAPDRRRVLVVPFEHTGDSAAATIAQLAQGAIARELSQSGLVRVVIGAAGAETPGLAAGGTGAGLLVMGSVHGGNAEADGPGVVLEAVVIETATGQVVGRVKPTTISLPTPAPDLTEFRERVAGAVVMAADFDLGDWTATSSPPPDLESYRVFVAGLDALRDHRADEADSLLVEAAARDSLFTTPLVWALKARIEAHRHASADSLARRLEPLRFRLSGADAAIYDYYVAYLRGPWEDAYQAAKRLVEITPTADWKRLLAGAALAANRPREAMRVLGEIARARDPWIRDWPLRWQTWTMAHHALGEYQEELDLAREWADRDSAGARLTEVRALAGFGRVAELEAFVDARVAEGTTAGRRLLWEAAGELLGHGHAALADRFYARAMALADANRTTPDSSIGVRFERAKFRLIAGRYAEADRLLQGIDSVPDLPRYLVWALRGLAAAGVGRTEEARAYADTLVAHEPPLGAGTRTMKAARILAALGDRPGATELFRRAIEQGHGFYYWLHTVREFQALRDYPPFEEFLTPSG